VADRDRAAGDLTSRCVDLVDGTTSLLGNGGCFGGATVAMEVISLSE